MIDNLKYVYGFILNQNTLLEYLNITKYNSNNKPNQSWEEKDTYTLVLPSLNRKLKQTGFLGHKKNRPMLNSQRNTNFL